jgi:hypothetical protein
MFIPRRRSTTQVKFLRGWRGHPVGSTAPLAVHLADELVSAGVVRRISDPRPSPSSELPPAPAPVESPAVTQDDPPVERAPGGSVKTKGKARDKKKRGKGSRGHRG